MQLIANTLYVTSSPAYMRLESDTVVVERDGEPKRTLPLLAFSGMVLFGDVMVTPALLARCAQDGLVVTFLDQAGRFRARVEGQVSGNVLLRLHQYRLLDSPEAVVRLARSFVAGKIQNSRQNIVRGLRSSPRPEDVAPLEEAAQALASSLGRLGDVTDLDTLRGVEGDAARVSFRALNRLILGDRDVFATASRSRRPPLDPMNALLSFLYTLIVHDCRGALESVGLDPQAGFLHALRPGRPALALDLAEEFRPILGDRLALTLVNRRQLKDRDFITRPGGAVLFTDAARKTVVTAYVERKREEVEHPASGQKVPLGIVPHLQARLLARTIRGELEEYPPYLVR